MDPYVNDEEQHELQVRLTAMESVISKNVCVQKGYYKDSFVKYFVNTPEKRSPIINRGYFVRVCAVDTLTKRFIEAFHGNCQVLNLGGGLDTQFFRLHEQGIKVKKYVELDLIDNVQKKCSTILKTPQLSEIVFTPQQMQFMNELSTLEEIRTSHYSVIACSIIDTDAVNKVVTTEFVDTTLPTLIISECVLIYISATDSNPTLTMLQQVLTNSMIVVYEQILPFDPFGRQMVKNLEERGCDLLSITEYPTLDTQIERFKSYGYTSVEAEDMYHIYFKLLDPADTRRIAFLEVFDEFEEYNLFQTHYCIVCAANGSVAEKEVFSEKIWKMNKMGIPAPQAFIM